MERREEAICIISARWRRAIEVGSGLCFSSVESTRCIETARYLLGMETSSVDPVEF
jgi:hypothetical protein